MTQPEHLIYDADQRAIYDANRLQVAADVGPADAPLIIFGDRLRHAAQAVLDANSGMAPDFMRTEAERLEDVLDNIKAYEDREADAPPRQPSAQPLATVMLEALAYQRDAFENDEDVNGGDMVEWFAQWRLRLKAASSVVPFDVSAVMRDQLADMADTLDDAITTHIYDLDNGDEIEPDCGYTRAVAEARALLDMTSGAPAGAVAVIKGLQGALSFLDQQVDQMKGLFPDDDGQIAEAQQDAEDAQTLANQFLQTVSDPAQIVVIVEGGLVQAITPTRRLPGVEVVVIDYDVEGSSDPLSEVAQSADSSADWAKAVVTSYDMGDGSDLIDPPVIRDAEEGEGA